MAELDPYILFRQKEYSGPTQDELDTKQDMNALRNMLGNGVTIDSPGVVNAMMARNPDLGMKLATNASTLQTNAATAQAKQQETMAAELDRYVPMAMAVAQNKDQAAWTELHGHLTQMFPELGRSLPTDVSQATPAIQAYIEARRNLKGVTSALPYQATEMGGYLQRFNRATGQMELVLGSDGRPMPANAVTTATIGANAGIERSKIGAAASMNNAALRAQNATELQTNKALNAAALAGAPAAAIPMGAAPPTPAANAPQSKPEAAARVKLDTAYPQASAAIVQTEHDIDSQIALLDKLAADKGLDAIAGPIASRTPDVSPEANRARAYMKTLLAQGGFDALRNLKVQNTTLGQVTEGEHKLLREALGTLDLAQNAADVRAALKTYRDKLLFSKQNIRNAYDQTYAYKAGGAAGAPAPAGDATAPAPTTSGW